MDIYKIVFWVLVCFAYLFAFWFVLPNIRMGAMEMTYLLAVVQSHVAVFGLLGIVIVFGWITNKAGY